MFANIYNTVSLWCETEEKRENTPGKKSQAGVKKRKVLVSHHG
jgi:hypothetical protein